MSITPRARELAVAAAEAAADKLAEDIVAFDVSEQLVITDAFLLCSAPNDRQVKSIVDARRGAAARAGRQAGAPRGRARGPLGAARLRRHHRARAARRGAGLLLPRAALEGLPDRRAARRACAGAAPRGQRLRGRPARLRRPGRAAGAASDEQPATRTPPARRVVLWRHGQTAWNAEGRFQGHTDIEPRRGGSRPGGSARRGCWPPLRPRRSCPPTSPAPSRPRRRSPRLTGVAVRADERLRETYGGAWQGLTVERDPGGGRRGLRPLAGRRRTCRPAAARRARDVAGARAAGGARGRRTRSRRAHGRRGRHPRRYGARRASGRCSGCRWTAGRSSAAWPTAAGRCWGAPVAGRAGGWLEHNAGTLPEPVLGDEG